MNKDNFAYAVGLARELHALSVFAQHGPEFDWSYYTAVLTHGMESPNYFILLARLDGAYVGAVWGKVENFYFSPKRLGLEEAWYVRENTPNRAAIGKQLMQAFVDWCINEQDAVMVQSGDIAGINPSRVDALYRHMGFTRFGVLFKYVRTT